MLVAAGALMPAKLKLAAVAAVVTGVAATPEAVTALAVAVTKDKELCKLIAAALEKALSVVWPAAPATDP